VSESEYNSSDEDELDDDQNRQPELAGGPDQEDMFLNPIAKSKLAHLLARLPTSLSKIRKGDIARVAAFAITHASKGSDEIVDMIVSNVEQPFSYTSANPDYKQDSQGKNGREGDSREPSPAAEDKAGANDSPDTSAARLIGLYVISDILSSSSTSGVRHAWRYRQLFETALRERKIFESLGTMAEKYSWGRLRAEKWKRSVGLILSLWEGWCVFPAETQEFFVQSFENPPQLRNAEKEAEETQKKANGRWKTVADTLPLPVSQKPPSRSASPDDSGDADRLLETGDTDGEIAYSFAGYSDDDGADGSDGDIDGEPVEDIEQPQRHVDVATSAPSAKAEAKAAAGFQMLATKPAPSRKRMRAVDMFADSGSEDGD
jgi:U2-associated protein SR140